MDFQSFFKKGIVRKDFKQYRFDAIDPSVYHSGCRQTILFTLSSVIASDSCTSFLSNPEKKLTLIFRKKCNRNCWNRKRSCFFQTLFPVVMIFLSTTIRVCWSVRSTSSNTLSNRYLQTRVCHCDCHKLLNQIQYIGIRYRGKNSTTAEEFSRLQRLFSNPSWLV